MTRSKKDGRSKGGHKNTQGKEYWSRRPGAPMGEPGRESKRLTHRAERRETRLIERLAADFSEPWVRALEEIRKEVDGTGKVDPGARSTANADKE